MREISGDIPLSWGKRIWYLLYNAIRNFAGLRYPLKMEFWHKTFDIRNDSSPARSYLDAFMEHEIPKLFLPRVVSVLDIGCGSAYMRSVLAKSGYSGSYLGIDVVHEPKFDINSIPEFQTRFLNQGIEDFSTREFFDLVLSNTSLEHIPDDGQALSVAYAVTAPEGIEVHIVPSLWSLPLYLWHGYRQYTPARIRSLFKGKQYRIFRLGGLPSFVLHFLCITLPERFIAPRMVRKYAIYTKLKMIANRLDRFLPFCSVIYAVVVFHRHE